MPLHLSYHRFLLYLIFLLSPIYCYGGENTLENRHIIEYVDAKKLYNSPTWLKLIHYKSTSKSHFKSEIISPSFFLSKTGQTSPREELLVNIFALLDLDSITKDFNLHPQCKFPSRYVWIASQLEPLKLNFPKTHCTEYDRWKKDAQIRSISLIYASGFFDNPASYYGHLLLKLNSTTRHGSLLDTSINFGAEVPENENVLSYIFKGIFGGYDSRFSYNFYYKNKNIYSQIEMRDMWEYELNFTEKELELITSHIWELFQHDFQYFFIKQNCAYRIGELVELPLKKDLFNKTKPWILPIDVIKSVVNYENLLNNISYIPSKRTTFEKKYLNSNQNEQRFIRVFINSKKSPTMEDENFNDSSKSRILDTLFDYYASTYIGDFNNPEYTRKRQVLLATQLELPFQEIKTYKDPQIEPPHLGHSPSLVQVSVFRNNEINEGLYLRIRPTYYDYLSRDSGRRPYSSLSMLDFTLAYANQKLAFHSMDIIKIANLDITKTDINSLAHHSWNLRLGLEPQSLNCKTCTVSFIEGGLGKSYKRGENFIFYGFVEGRLQSKTKTLLSGTPKLGFIGKIMNGWHGHAFIGYRKFIDKTENGHFIGLYENRFGDYQNGDARLTFKMQDSTFETSVSLNYYW